MSTEQREPLAFLGIGHMGAAIVLALLKGSHPVTIWNRTADRPLVKQCTSAGAILAPTVADTIANTETILACFIDDSALKTSLDTLPADALAGKTIINITSGTPKEADEIRSFVLVRGVKNYIDAAIMVPPAMVAGPQSFLVVSGEDAPFVEDVVTPLLAPVGKAVYMGPEIGAAARYDLAALAVMYGMLSGGYLGMALLKKGSNGGKIAPLMESSIGPMIAALVPLLAEQAKDWDEENFDNNGGSPLGMQLHGVHKIIESAKDDGIDAGVLEHLAGVMGRVVKEHGGDGSGGRIGPYLFQ